MAFSFQKKRGLVCMFVHVCVGRRCEGREGVERAYGGCMV